VVTVRARATVPFGIAFSKSNWNGKLGWAIACVDCGYRERGNASKREWCDVGKINVAVQLNSDDQSSVSLATSNHTDAPKILDFYRYVIRWLWP
jgi:hypothetical protein